MTDPTFVYVTYIEASPERVWQALTDPVETGHVLPGAPWEMTRA